MDPETLTFIRRQRQEDYAIVAGIKNEQKHIEFRYGHAERYNQWKSEELHLERTNLAEAAFLEKIHDEEEKSILTRQEEHARVQMEMEKDLQTFSSIMNEMKSLNTLCNQNKAAAERMKRAKQILKERREAVQQHLQRVEARQDKERKSLADAHARQLRTMNLSRNLELREVEDPEIRIVLRGLEYNSKSLGDEHMRMKQDATLKSKVFHAKVLAQMVRNQKEIEQLREIHLLQLKHITRYCDREIEIIDETETLLAENMMREQRQEAQFQSALELEEARVQSQLATVRVQVEQHHVHELAKLARQGHRREARKLVARQRRQTRRRENEFWQREEELLKQHLDAIGMHLEAGTPEYEAKLNELLPGFAEMAAESRSSTESGENDDDDDVDDMMDPGSMTVGHGGMLPEAADLREVEKQQAREMAMLEALKKQQRMAMKKIKRQHLKLRETMRVEQEKSLKAILEAQATDVARLKEQQAKEMQALEETQATSDKLEEDNKLSNDRLYAMLPRFVADKMKSGQPVEPTHYENVTVLIADIVSFTALSSKSSANQIVTLLNRLYSEMDNVLDRYEDVYKLETIGDAYCIVAGLNNRERSVRENAKDVIECALSFIEIVQKLDMSDQVQDKIEIRVGVHTGPAVGGVANPSMPKFSLFGDTITTTGLLEQTSRKMHVHISGATHELIQDAFETDVSESIAVDCGPQKGKKKVASYWVVGKKRGAGGSSGAGAIGLSSIGGSSAYSHGSSGAEREKGGYTVGGGSGGDGGSRAVPSILTTSADGAQGKDRGARQVSIQGMPFSRLNKNMQ